MVSYGQKTNFSLMLFEFFSKYLALFTDGPGGLGSIPGQVLPKTKIMVLDDSLLNTQYYKVRIKWSNPGIGVAPYPTPRCSS